MEDFFSWNLILLPAVFAVGWLAARLDIKQLIQHAKALPSSYLQGLNFLLRDETDKAIGSFQAAVKISPDTVELHFALGALLRRKGEFEQAIRIHKEILGREDLALEQRHEALYQLGLDYHRAGFLDLAEDCFTKLDETDWRDDSLRRLLSIHRIGRDWERAISVIRRIKGSTAEIDRHMIAHFYCEWASDVGHNLEKRKELLEKALEIDPDCGRANVLLGDVDFEEDNLENALEKWGRLEHQQPAALHLLPPRLMRAYDILGNLEEGERLLQRYLERFPSEALFVSVFEAIAEFRGFEAVADLPTKYLKDLEGGAVLGKWFEIKRRLGSDAREEYEQACSAFIRDFGESRHTCRLCGFRSKRFYWQCPGCQELGTYLWRQVEVASEEKT